MANDYMSDLYTPFEQNMALSWASIHFNLWLKENPNASPSEQEKSFFDCVESGLTLALDFRNQNS